MQQALPEPDKEEIFKERRRRRKAVRNISGPVMQILLFFAGVLCAIGFVRTLWYPEEIRQQKDQIQQMQISAEGMRKDKESLQEQVKTAAELLQAAAKDGKEGKVLQAGVLADITQLLQDWGIEKQDES